MEDLLYLLAFVFFFVILPMLQRARKGQAPPQPSRRPQRSGGRDTPSVPPTYDEDPSYDDEAIQASSSPPRAEQRTAEGVLPDDLWEILTGERREPTRPEPKREDDTPQYDEAEVGHEPYARDHEREREAGFEWEDVSGESPERWEPEPEPIPVPVPLPRPVQLPDPARAARTVPRTTSPHRAGSGLQAKAVRPVRAGRRLNIALNLDTRDELRRAMILREVLGPPKGLE